jgi:hypothetical protein
MDFKKDYEFNTNTCLALLLQFKTPIVYDLTMPDATDIKRLAIISGRILNGEIITSEEITCVTSNSRYDSRQYLEKGKFFTSLSPRVCKGMEDVFLEDRETDSFLFRLMGLYGHLLSNEWYPGKGTLYKFREGKRAESEIKVKSYFNNEELSDFDKIGTPFPFFVDRVSAPHPGS